MTFKALLFSRHKRKLEEKIYSLEILEKNHDRITAKKLQVVLRNLIMQISRALSISLGRLAFHLGVCL